MSSLLDISEQIDLNRFLDRDMSERRDISCRKDLKLDGGVLSLGGSMAFICQRGWTTKWMRPVRGWGCHAVVSCNIAS